MYTIVRLTHNFSHAGCGMKTGIGSLDADEWGHAVVTIIHLETNDLCRKNDINKHILRIVSK